MGRMKEYWMESCSKVLNEFDLGTITYERASEELIKLNATSSDLARLKMIKRWHEIEDNPGEDVRRIKKKLEGANASQE